MPVDDVVLETTVSQISAKLTEVNVLRQKLRTLLTDAQNIQEVDIPDPTVEDRARTRKEKPKDSVLGTEISVTRRQEIYDKVMADKVTLGV